jgi:hypothetical protein
VNIGLIILTKMDKFDKIRSAIYTHNSAAITGILWCSEWTYAPGGIIDKEGTPTGGHAFIFIGQKTINDKLYLVAQLSNGKSIGDNGLFYFSREIVNKLLNYGTYMFVDMPRELAQQKSWTWFQKLLNFFKR